MAYPYGIVTTETAGHIGVGFGFKSFNYSWNDWWRMPIYGLLLRLSLIFSEPSMIVYWGQSILFAINIALTSVLGATLFRSRTTGIWLAISLLFTEVISMRTFFASTQIFADTALANLLYMGAVLTLIGWRTRKTHVIYTGYAILGLSSFVKQIGISIIPLWIAFAVYMFARRKSTIHHTYSLVRVVACTMILIGLNGLWSVRNGFLYDRFKPSALGGHELLAHVMPLVNDNDNLFDDVTKNKSFISVLRIFEHKKGNNFHNTYAWGGGSDVPGPLELLGKPSSNMYTENSKDVEKLFHSEKNFLQTAMRIISLHPLEYFSMVTKSYYNLFSPGTLMLDIPQMEFQSDIMYGYNSYLVKDRSYDMFYPNGIDHNRVNTLVRGIFSLCCGRTKLSFIPFMTNHRGAVLHAIFAVSLLILIIPRIKRRTKEEIRATALTIALIFLTSVSLYIPTAATQYPLARLSLGAEMLLHLMELLAIFATLHASLSAFRARSSLHQIVSK
jgi:hypothetical protein